MIFFTRQQTALSSQRLKLVTQLFLNKNRKTIKNTKHLKGCCENGILSSKQCDRGYCLHFHFVNLPVYTNSVVFLSRNVMLSVYSVGRPRGHIFCILLTGTPIVDRPLRNRLVIGCITTIIDPFIFSFYFQPQSNEDPRKGSLKKPAVERSCP